MGIYYNSWFGGIIKPKKGKKLYEEKIPKKKKQPKTRTGLYKKKPKGLFSYI